MQKKVLLAAVLALFVWGGAFAQEAEVPETGMPETEAPAVESSNGGGSSILDSMYAGLDIGTDFGSFYMAPRVGITPFKKIPKLSFEFLFGMQLGGKYQPDMFAYEVEPDWEINIFTPTILATYTFSDWMIRPYIGLGFGINFFTVKDKTWEYKDATHWYKVDDSMKIAPSFNTLFTAGGKYAIPNTNFELNAGLNLSFTVMSCENTYTDTYIEYVRVREDTETFNTFHAVFNFVLGAVYHF
jgi:outer membrane protein W